MTDAAAPTQAGSLRRALAALEQMQARLDVAERARHAPIAVVGMGCRFPGGVTDLDTFWQLLRAGVDAVSEVPADRWDIDAYYDPDPDAPGKMASRWGGFVDGIDGFDPQLFGITPREAAAMDPQQRLVLEVGWEALENAGIAPHSLAGSATGVFVGIVNNDYEHLSRSRGGQEQFGAYFASGSAQSIAAGRLSYLLGLQGPSIALDTACSSSLVAVHLAVQSLRAGESSLALAGGVNAILIPEASIAISRYRMLSADGRCKTFDAAADGFARGEGCGLVVLKRLADALADGDRIDAVIRGSAVNQDGASSGLTAPNGPAQEAVIRSALADAGIAPADVGYVEAHGTGTSLGDPIEVQALAATLGPGRPAQRPLLIGSVKTNVGHLEAAAGIAGLIKLVLCLRHGEIPPHLHLRTPNPLIPWARLPVAVPQERTPWPGDAPRIGAVSSFGFSGTNAHLILAAAPEPERARATERPSHLLTLSARSETALRELTQRVAEHLAAQPETALGDVAHTTNAGRSHLSHRLALPADTTREALAQLQAVLAGQQPASVSTGQLPPGDPPRIAFLFTGQGSQYVGMGRRLYETEPTFRAALERCAAILDGHLERPLLTLLYPAAEDEAEAARLLEQTACTQPALFALEYALCALWRSWGIEPAAVLGHSVGEYVAACVAGVFGLEEGLALIAERARLMQALPAGGAMAAVLADVAVVEQAIAPWPGQLAIAAINGPDNVVVSGDEAALEIVLEQLQARAIGAKRLRVSHAFHSPLMDPVLEPFERAAAKVSFSPPRLRLISNLSGKPVTATDLSKASYWRDHIRAPVQFARGMRALQSEGITVFVEVGPGSTLLGMGRQSLPEDGLAWLPSLRQDRDDWTQMLDALAGLHVRGVPIDWAAFDRPYGYLPVALPTYPFERQRYWIEDKGRKPSAAPRTAGAHPLLGQRLRSALPQTQFENELAADSFAFIADHRVQGRPILPAAAFLELALAAAAEHFGPSAAGGLVVEDLVIGQTLDLADGAVRIVQTVVDPHDAQRPAFRVLSQADSEATWQLHAQGRLASGGEPTGTDAVAAIRARCTELWSADEHQARMRAHGLDFGPAMHGVVEIHRRDGEAVGRIRAPEDVRGETASFRLHPAVLDACLQVVGAALPERALPEPYLPMSVDACRWFGRPAAELWSHVVLDLPGGALPDTLRADVRLLDDTGKLLAEVAGLSLRRYTARRAGGDRFEDWLYEVAWRPAPRQVDAPAPVISPPVLADAIDAALPAAAERHGLAAEEELYPQLEALSAAYVAHAVQRLGWRPEPGRTFTSEEMAQACGILPRYNRLLPRLLDILAEDGLLARDGDAWRVLRSGEPGEQKAHYEDLVARYPSCGPQLRLTGNCGSELAGALTGAVDPLSLLFPGGSLDLAERLYRESPKALVYNGLVEAAMRAALAELGGRRLRILEIGAGTGATTASVLPVLPADRAEYVFTDLSPAFLSRARERFADYPFVDYRLLDIERDPADQGFAGERFDIVLAVNVLHATADLTQTLRHVRSLLAPRGLLVLVEGTGPERWIDVTFGLTDGWWRFTDTATRQGYPLLSPERWIDLLSAEGFEATAVAPADAVRHRQAILLARAPANLAEQSGSWLVCGDAAGVGERLAALLRSRGQRCVVATAGDTLDDLLHEAVADADRPLRGIVHLAALDAPEPTGADSLEPMQREVCGSVLGLVQVLGRMAIEPPRLWLVTRGAQAVADGEPVMPAQAQLWGLATVLRQEHPELRCVTLDLDAAEPSAQAAALLDEVLHPDREDRVALRAGIRHVARLVRSQLPSAAAPAEAPEQPVRLEVPAGGVLDEIGWTTARRRAPGPGEVEIRVHATGLNFRDVMNALAMRDDPEPLGGECSGVVMAVGAGVEGLAIGDQVIAVALGGFASHVTVDAGFVLPKPPRLPLADAAGLPLAFLTAYYCLHEVAGLAAGERILVHAAAGGVGLAAVRLAQHAGAEVFATAGSDGKRAFLRSLGVAHVFDSRSLGFADGVLEATGGRGVDVVLNSLTGELIAHSFAALAERGRFLEIGKREILSAEQVARLKPEARYHAIDLASEVHAQPAAVRPLFARAMELVTSGAVEPLPVTLFPAERVADAFRFMAQARHIGKIVVTRPIEDAASRPDAAPAARRDGSYLITGGLGGLGLLTARWLAERGAGALVLLGRSPPSEAAAAAIRDMESAGARVQVTQGDVARAADLRRVLDAIDRDLPPLRGIIHAAGVLEDGALVRQDWQQFARVLAPKVDGAWLLHTLTHARPLDFFVLFSSIASILGTPGQASHAAANAFMDALAHHRRAAGLPALAIGWGVWSEIGSAAARGTVERVAGQGAGAIAPTEGLRVLESLLGSGRPYVAVQPIDWQRYLAPAGETPPWLCEIAREAPGPAPSATAHDAAAPARAQADAVLAQLAAAPAGEHGEILLAHVHEQVLQVIGLGNGQSIDPLQPLSSLGVDSLMAVELRNRLGKSLAVPRPLPATLVFDYPTIGGISGYLAREVLGLEAVPARAPGEPRSGDLLEDIESLSDDEVDELFADIARPHAGAPSWS